jgi:hypothetical protein
VARKKVLLKKAAKRFEDERNATQQCRDLKQAPVTKILTVKLFKKRL